MSLCYWINYKRHCFVLIELWGISELSPLLRGVNRGQVNSCVESCVICIALKSILSLWMMTPSVNIQRLKSSGPITEPYGTPYRCLFFVMRKFGMTQKSYDVISRMIQPINKTFKGCRLWPRSTDFIQACQHYLRLFFTFFFSCFNVFFSFFFSRIRRQSGLIWAGLTSDQLKTAYSDWHMSMA